jgi:hypothetical protein
MELAIVRSCSLTEINRMPVITGTMKPPRKRRDHIRNLKSIKLSTKGIGSAEATAKIEIIQHICRAFGEL